MSMMRVVAGAAVALALACGVGGVQAADGKTVAITAIVEHPALDAVREGVIAALADAGYKAGAGVTIEFQSAQGNPATAAQIARRFIGQKPDVIVPISTPSAQAVVAATRDLPVVFSVVTDPVGAQLVKSLEASGTNVTGVSDMAPVADHLALIAEMVPSAKRIGVVYNPGETNSVSMVKALKDAAAARGLTVVEAAAAKSADVQAAGRGLVGKVDAVYVPLDNTVVSALEGLLAVGAQSKLPVFAADSESVARGAVATIGFNYRQIGEQTGAMVVRVLKGEKPGSIPVELGRGSDLVVNAKAAAAMGVTVPELVTRRATKIIP